MFFEDFDVDRAFVLGGRTVADADIMQFAELSGDFSDLHTNEERAKQSAYGRRVAHGALIFSISIGLTTQSGLLDDSLIAFYGIDGLRFTKPVFIGDTVSVRKRVFSREEKGAGRGLVTFATRVVNQHDALVLVYRDTLLIKMRG
jgi:3-hydroxybutyryl-CoA dehydratase